MGPGDYRDVCRLERLAYGRCEGGPDALARVMAGRGRAGFVADRGRECVGYLVFHLHPTRRLLGLADLVVHPAHRRRGVARRLLGHLLARAAGVPELRVVAAVEESLLPAQLFLRAMGFRCYQIVPGGLAGEDAYLFRYAGPAAAAPPLTSAV
jgi:ribosomal protein S18 acetylase RimI-like enzyme